MKMKAVAAQLARIQHRAADLEAEIEAALSVGVPMSSVRRALLDAREQSRFSAKIATADHVDALTGPVVEQTEGPQASALPGTELHRALEAIGELDDERDERDEE